MFVSLSDAVLVVAREGYTPHDDIQHSLSSLRGVLVAGLVLNGSETSRCETYDSYYRGRAPDPH
jgi:Mrp family chromosome partitioning ATPase